MTSVTALLRLVACLAAAGMLGGCAVVRIQNAATGNVEVKQRFGIVSVEVVPGTGATIVEATSLGMINGFQGFTVGYHSATLASVPPGECRLVLWIKTGDELTELNALLRDRTDVCVVRPDDSIRRKP